MSLWMLTLISLAQGVPGELLSVAGTLRVVRAAMTQRRTANRQPLAARLHHARRDNHRRTSGKVKRHWPRKARLHRCGTPLARTAKDEEIRRFQDILANAA